MSSNETISRDELFKQSQAARKKEREEAAKNPQGNNYARDYEELAYNDLSYGNTKVVRLLGNPKDNRMGDPCSPKSISFSWIIGDNDKPARYIWPLKEENPSWILWKIYNKVLSGDWDQTLNGGKGGKIYHYVESHKAIFARVAKNNRTDNAIESGWRPATQVVWNHIDRSDMKWHKENKHTKLLSKKGSYNKEKNKWSFEPGIAESTYYNVWDNIVEHYSDWLGYDVAIKKVKTGPDPTNVAYNVLHSSHIQEIDENVRQFIVNGPLTEEELSWERYNLDKIFAVSSYQKIKRNLGIFIASVDAAFKTNYSQELDALVEEEKKVFSALYGNENRTADAKSEPKKESTPVPQQESKPVSEPSRSVRKPVEDQKAFDANSLDPVLYIGIAKLTDEYKKKIVGKNDDGTLVYAQGSGQLAACGICKAASPDTFPVCPSCGAEFEI